MVFDEVLSAKRLKKLYNMLGKVVYIQQMRSTDNLIIADGNQVNIWYDWLPTMPRRYEK